MSGWAAAAKVAGDLTNTALSAWSAHELNASNWQHQKELAQNQVQWRVEDAKKAGLHPLAALGISPSSYSPATALPDYSGLSGVGDTLYQMGQNADREAMQAKTQAEQQKAVELNNQLLEAQIRLTNSQAAGQDVQNDSFNLENVSKLVRLGGQLQPNATTGSTVGTKSGIPGQTPVNSGLPGRTGSYVKTGEPMYQFMLDSKGGYSLQPGNDYSQVYEDKGFLLEGIPIFKTVALDYWNRATGNVIDGMVYSDKAEAWVPEKSAEGKRVVAESAAHRFRRWRDDASKWLGQSRWKGIRW